jgi:hypothetical protein
MTKLTDKLKELGFIEYNDDNANFENLFYDITTDDIQINNFVKFNEKSESIYVSIKSKDDKQIIKTAEFFKTLVK